MAIPCIRPARLCNGCGACRPIPRAPRCAACGRAITGGEYYYDIDGRALCADCLDSHVKEA